MKQCAASGVTTLRGTPVAIAGENTDWGRLKMKKRVKLSVFEQSVLDRRSDILFYGPPEIFLDGVVDDQIDVSPEATAAKIVADFAHLFAVLSEKCGVAPDYDKIDVTGPMGRLIEPLVSGDRAYLSDAESSTEIFANILEWVGSGRWFQDTESGGQDNRFVIIKEDGGVGLDGDAIAAYLTLSILLDSADVQIVVDRDLRLDVVHTFRCFSHLLGQVDRLVAHAAMMATTPELALREVFAEGIQCLANDGIVRGDDDADIEGQTLH